MKRRAFIRTASIGAMGLLGRVAGAQKQQPPKAQPKIPGQAKAPAQRIIPRIQQLADGGS